MIRSFSLSAPPWFWRCAFVCLALPVCIARVLAVPLGDVADEVAHMARAVALSQGQLVGHRESLLCGDGTTHVAAGVTVGGIWAALGRSRPPDFCGTLIPEGTRPKADGGTFMPLYTIATYPPVLYVPGALGILAGRPLGLTPAASVYLGRFTNVAAYTVLGFAALALATRGHLALFTLLVLPMSLSLAASFNQDGLIIALSALATALLTPCPPAKLNKRLRYLLATLIVCVIVLAKPPYAPLAAMLLVPLPSLRQFGMFWRHRFSLMVLVLIPAALWTVGTTVFVATPVPRLVQ